MTSRVNHEANYKYSIDALTPWERLRVVRNFLNERKEQLEVAEIGLEVTKRKLSELENDEDWYKQMEAKKIKAQMGTSVGVIEKARDEVEFLERYHQECIEAAEPTRIPGYSDEEMFEYNYENELIEKHIHSLKADLIAFGRPSTSTAKALMQMPPAIDRCIEIGIMGRDAFSFGLPDKSQENKLEDKSVAPNYKVQQEINLPGSEYSQSYS